MPTRYEVLPIPALLAYTELFSAGAIQVGVEFRLLNEKIIEAEFGRDAREKFGKNVPEDLQSQVDEEGVSIHVFDRSGEQEFLRFDCFEDYPHYHYIENEPGHQTVHGFDSAADGPMYDWVMGCLASRLPEMLRQAGETALAEGIDQGTVEKILPDVAAAIERARKSGRPIPVAE
jgi:hypothetical protein